MALKRYEDLCKDRHTNARIGVNELERNPFHYTMAPKDLRERRERKKLLEERRLQYQNGRHVASILAKRFELLLEGRIRHSWNRVKPILGTKKAQNP